MKLKVGDTIWVFDENHRRYDKNRRCIYREFWVKQKITKVGRKYLYTDRYKLDFKGHGDFGVRGILVSQSDVDQDCWIHDNVHKIREAIYLHKGVSFEKLKAIYAILFDDDENLTTPEK